MTKASIRESGSRPPRTLQMSSHSSGRRLRMEDIAARAGVSQMTVSRALRTPDKVADATRDRIAAAMAEVDYVPDLVAGSLAARRSGLIAAVISTFENAIFAETIAGLTACIEAAGYTLLLGSSGYSTADEERLLLAILGRRPDGIVLTGAFHTPRARRLLSKSGIPIVETWELPDDPVDMAVGFDNVGAGRAMTRALLGWGYRRIVFVGPSLPTDTRGHQRREGYRAAMTEAGLARREIMAPPEPPGIGNGPALFAKLMAEFDDADAVFCSLDAVAAGLVFAARRHGIDVPGRLAVAGFGDFAIAQPSGLDLTTIRIAGRGMGTRAGELLLACLAGSERSTQVVDVGFEVVRRSSA